VQLVVGAADAAEEDLVLVDLERERKEREMRYN
jgi:hypothetical protein